MTIIEYIRDMHRAQEDRIHDLNVRIYADTNKRDELIVDSKNTGSIIRQINQSGSLPRGTDEACDMSYHAMRVGMKHYLRAHGVPVDADIGTSVLLEMCAELEAIKDARNDNNSFR